MQYRVPMTEIVAQFRNTPYDNGYGWTEVHSLGGKLIEFILDHAIDFETAEILMVSAMTQEDRIIDGWKQSFETCKTIDGFIDMGDRIFQNPVEDRNLLNNRDVFLFDFEPMDTVTIGPDLWLQREMSRARQLGLIISVNDHILPMGLMNSMGPSLVRYAQKHNLI
jgi:hypothetical protein